MSGVHKLVSVELDTVTLPAATAEIEHERRVAIFDLVEKNSFEPVGAPDDAEGGGRYRLKLSLQDNRLVFDIDGGGFTRTYAISLTPLKGVLRDYLMICDSYYSAIRNSTPQQIEALDMGRRGLHNEGAEQLKTRLDGKIIVDHETARRLFTLLCALYRRG
ncbi:MAG: UPF0262 family protein [Alphaproteobacteria bacterium]|nr:UPF0262 family protein [Alphaproteobacteria bacterium]